MESDSIRNDYEAVDQVGIKSEFNELMREWTVTESNSENGLELGNSMLPQYNNYPFDYKKCLTDNKE